MRISLQKAKRAVSPVVATILLISLVVAASAMVYFIVVPLLRGSASVDFITTQWFDSDGDEVADLVYITLQNTGSAGARIDNITLTINNDVLGDRTIIDNAELVVETLPLEMDVTARVDLAISFDPSDLIAVGTNQFQLMIIYDDGQASLAPENLNHVEIIYPLEMTVLNPINGSWVKGIIDPQVLISGGYLPSEVTYDFVLPDETVALADQPLANNIDSTTYADDVGYEMIFYVNDSLGQSSAETNIFNIDNKAIGVTLGLNDTSILQGEAIEASWTFDDVGGAPLVNQTLVLSGDVRGSDSVFTSNTATVTQYVLTEAETFVMAEDDFTFTLYVKDAVGNLNSSGASFSLIDITGPTTYFISPLNDTDQEDYIEIEVYASDPSGIDTARFDVFFISLTSDFQYFYSQQIDGDASYNPISKTWQLLFSSYVLPDDTYSIIAQVFDDSSNGNGASAIVDAVYVDNDVLDLYGATATDGRGGFFFRRRGLITFYIGSNVPSTVLTITKVKFNWGASNRIDYIYTAYDDTLDQYWLDSGGGPYYEDVEYNVAAVQGGVNVTDAIDHHLTLSLNYGDRPTTTTFTVSFYIESIAFTGWEVFVIYF